jgi:hypothetical protein
MFEDIMGWLLIFVLPVVAVFTIVKLNTARKQKRAREQARREETLAILKQEREASRMRTGMYAAKNTPPRARSTSQPVASTTTDSSIDWVTPALIMATMNSNSGAVSARADESANSVTFTEEKVSQPNSSWSSYNDSSSSSDSGSSSSWD